MALVSVRQLSFQYSGSKQPALKDVSFSFEEGEFVVLCGPSGCGKSTLLHHLKSVFTPCGVKSGAVYYDEALLETVEERRQCSEIGFVGQSPDNQLVTDKVWHELAFGLESLGMEQQTIRSNVAETASFFGIEKWFYKDVNTLSGGQKQLLVLASVMVMEPKLLLLDEPTSQLDPIAAEEFLSMVARINRELGVTIFMSEHHLDSVMAYANRMLVLKEGKLLAEGTPDAVAQHLRQEAPDIFLSMPVPVRIWAALNWESPCPWTVTAGRDWLRRYGKEHIIGSVLPEQSTESVGETKLRVEHIWFRYDKGGDYVLQGTSLSVKRGELVALLGGNGTGKSTLFSLITGIYKPERGKIYLEDRLGVLPQNPKTLFTGKTLEKDLLDLLKEHKVAPEEQRKRMDEVLQFCQLTHKADSHPYDLSGGQLQRAALAKVLLLRPKILLLDEPTKGMDRAFKIRFAGLLKQLQEQGTAILMASHDLEFCADYASRCALLFSGEIVSENTPRQFFGKNRFYTTAVSRMAKGIIPDAVTEKDVLTACETSQKTDKKGKGKTEKNEQLKDDDKSENIGEIDAVEVDVEKKRRYSHSTVWTIIALFLLIPITIYIGVAYLGNQKYLFISLLVLLEGMLPFFLLFEGRKPKPRELVVLAVLCALGVASRSVFYMLPQIKPVAALTMISGIAFGGETGFLVGALTMLTSNMLFGQGPWTPWQMFAMGMIGFLTGLLYRRSKGRKNVVILAGLGFILVFVVYGGIMNLASAVMAHAVMNLKTIASYYVTGIPMDMLHGLATAVFLVVLANPVLGKLERMKIKYGVLTEK
jgi:energy-coupling factor transporter ATP-binding protein EcfA2/uncharacterized membrane protein